MRWKHLKGKRPLDLSTAKTPRRIKSSRTAAYVAKMMKGKDALLDSSNLEGTSEFLSRGINKKLRDFRVEYSKL